MARTKKAPQQKPTAAPKAGEGKAHVLTQDGKHCADCGIPARETKDFPACPTPANCQACDKPVTFDHATKMWQHAEASDSEACGPDEQLESIGREGIYPAFQRTGLAGAVLHALFWCRNDAANQDGFPSQDMLENRVLVLIEALHEAGIPLPAMDCEECGMLSVNPEEECPAAGRGVGRTNHDGRPYDASKDPTAGQD